MHKYSCRKCGQPAGHTDFQKNAESPGVFAVYVYCSHCKTHAWGGVSFHPEMNELFNELFAPNFEYVPSHEPMVLLEK